ncbi:MAG: hypothetical protein AAF629_21785 [Chloroflexota bacterium]
MPELKRLLATRIVSTVDALDTVNWPSDLRVLRTAPDEVLLIPPAETLEIDDPHAIVVSEGGFAGVWLDVEHAASFLEQACEWTVPSERPAFAQGAVADIPTKLWLEEDRVLFMVPAPYAAEFEERIP